MKFPFRKSWSTLGPTPVLLCRSTQRNPGTRHLLMAGEPNCRHISTFRSTAHPRLSYSEVSNVCNRGAIGRGFLKAGHFLGTLKTKLKNRIAGCTQQQTYLVFLCFTDIAFFFFYRLKVYGNPASSKSIGAIFPTAFAHFVSVSSRSRNSLSISNFFITIICVMVSVYQ